MRAYRIRGFPMSGPQQTAGVHREVKAHCKRAGCRWFVSHTTPMKF